MGIRDSYYKYENGNMKREVTGNYQAEYWNYTEEMCIRDRSLERVKEITGKEVTFYKGDILDRDFLESVFEKENIASCIHFAGLKAVGESVEKPWEYYHNNLTGTLILVDVLKKYDAKNLIFSSSATVYGCLLYTSRCV